MIINLNNINNFTDKELFAIVRPSLEKTHNFALYIGISELEFHNIVRKAIEQSRTANKVDTNINDYIVNRVNNRVNHILEEKLNDTEKGFEIINKYINDSFKEVNDYNEAIDYLKKIDSIFRKCHYLPEPDLLIKLINENKLFENIVKTIVDKNRSIIDNGNINNIFNNETILLAINSYCLINNIEVKEITYEDLDNINPNDELYLYKKDLSRFPLLSASKEYELAKKVKEGDKDARDEFINSNLRLVLSIAVKYRSSSLTLADLIQEGNIGLITAVNKYDPEKGYRFSTYATHWIRRVILSAILNKSRTIRVPINKLEKVMYFKKRFNQLSDTLGREPTFDELSKELHLGHDTVKEYYALIEDTVSLNQPVGDEDEIELGNLIPDGKESVDELALKNELPAAIQKLFDDCSLSDREKYILVKRFGLLGNDVCTLEEVGKSLNITRERARQIEARCLKKIRNSTYIKDFLVYMDNADKSKNKLNFYRSKYVDDRADYKKHIKDEMGDKEEHIKKISIYDLLSEYSQEEVDEALLELSSKDRDAIYENIYDKKVIKPIVKKMRVIILKSKETINNGYIKTKEVAKKNLSKKVNEENNKEEVETESPFIRELRNIERNACKSKESLDRRRESLENEILESSRKNKSVKTLIKENVDPRVIDKDKFNEMISKLPNAKDAIIIAMKYGLVDDICYEDEVLSKMFGVSVQEVKEITDEALEKHIEEMSKKENKKKTLIKKK